MGLVGGLLPPGKTPVWVRTLRSDKALSDAPSPSFPRPFSVHPLLVAGPFLGIIDGGQFL